MGARAQKPCGSWLRCPGAGSPLLLHLSMGQTQLLMALSNVGSMPPGTWDQPDPHGGLGMSGFPCGCCVCCPPAWHWSAVAVALGLGCRELQPLLCPAPVCGVQLLLWAILNSCAGLKFVACIRYELLFSLSHTLFLAICLSLFATFSGSGTEEGSKFNT